ncbi:MAG: AraC family transcriptional regulator [Bacteroidota bacterium]
MNSEGLLGMFAGIAVASSLFLAFYFFYLKKDNNLNLKLLGLVFVAIALRVAKSIWFFILYDVAPIGLALGFLGLASIGPLTYLYIRNSSAEKDDLDQKDYVNATLPIIGAVVVYFLNLTNVTILYKLTTVILLVYLILAWIKHFKADYESKVIQKWDQRILIVVSVVWASFIFQHLTDTMLQYAIGSGIASIPIYYAFILALTTSVALNKTQAESIPKEIVLRVKTALEEEKIYLKRNLNISEFAKQTQLPSYQVSKSVNKLYQKTFPETINYFRIRDVKEQLLNQSSEFLKIEGLAYENGFNTPSAFYAAFKKETGMSPKAYQKQYAFQKN